MTEPVDDADLQALTVAYAEAWNSHDVDGILDRLTDDIMWRRPGLSLPLRGKAQVAADVQGLFRAFPDLRFPLEDLEVFTHQDPHRAVSVWTCHGTMTGRLDPGFEPTGRPSVISGCTVYRYRHGLISDSTIVYDALDLLQQTGLMPVQGSVAFKVMLEAQNLTQRARAALHR